LNVNVPLTTESIFDVGSIAKQFTAASIVLLAQQGKLKLTDSARKYVADHPTFLVENNQLKLFGRKTNDPVAYPLAVDHFFFKPRMELSFTRDARKRITGFSLAVRATSWGGPAPNGITFTRLPN
jgi:beta-lactamase family protein